MLRHSVSISKNNKILNIPFQSGNQAQSWRFKISHYIEYFVYILYSLQIHVIPYLHVFYLYWGQSCCRGTRCDCKIDWLWVRSYPIFLFLRSGVKAKRGVEYLHSTRNGLNTRSPLPTLLCAGYLRELHAEANFGFFYL